MRSAGPVQIESSKTTVRRCTCTYGVHTVLSRSAPDSFTDPRQHRKYPAFGLSVVFSASNPFPPISGGCDRTISHSGRSTARPSGVTDVCYGHISKSKPHIINFCYSCNGVSGISDPPSRSGSYYLRRRIHDPAARPPCQTLRVLRS